MSAGYDPGYAVQGKRSPPELYGAAAMVGTRPGCLVLRIEESGWIVPNTWEN